jgi:hypothetical protein
MATFESSYSSHFPKKGQAFLFASVLLDIGAPENIPGEKSSCQACEGGLSKKNASFTCYTQPNKPCGAQIRGVGLFDFFLITGN